MPISECKQKPPRASTNTTRESLAVTRRLCAFPLHVVSPFIPTRHFGRTVDYALASTSFASRFSTTCTLEDPGLSSDHLALIVGFTPCAECDTTQLGEPEAPAAPITSFRLGKAVWSNPVVKTWALDVLSPLLGSAPLLSVPTSVGLLYLTAAMYLAFRTSATMVNRTPADRAPTYAKLYRDVAAVAVRCNCLAHRRSMLRAARWKYNISRCTALKRDLQRASWNNIGLLSVLRPVKDDTVAACP